MRENYLLDQMLADSINGSVVLLSNLHPFSRSDCPSMNLKCNTDECEIDFGIPTRTNCLEGGAPSLSNQCTLKFNRMHFNFNWGYFLGVELDNKHYIQTVQLIKLAKLLKLSKLLKVK